ncbi:MAG: cysteine hydrolase [Candidatus Binatia bacterium]
MIRSAGMEILETLDELVEPKHTALLMWDFAKNVVLNRYSSDDLVRNASRLLAAAREHGVLILFSHQNNMRIVGDTGAPTVRMRMTRAGKPVADIARQPEPKGFPAKPELVEEIRPREDEIVFEKFIPNAFLGTSFEWWLRKYAIKTIILAGVNVATGINGTAREAISRGFYAVIARDCVGTNSPEDYDAAIHYMEKIFDVFDATEIINSWKKKKR